VKYEKPEIYALSDAADIIETGIKACPGSFEFLDGTWCFQPAYDLDE
jgi:hypothetical protein